MPENHEKNNGLNENYHLIDLGEFIAVNKFTVHSDIKQRITFRINKKRLKGYTLNDPYKLYHLIFEIWQKK